MPLVETPDMGDWLRTGKRGIVELLIAHRIKNVCKLVEIMKEKGQDGSPIYKEVVAMCRQKRKKRARR